MSFNEDWCSALDRIQSRMTDFELMHRAYPANSEETLDVNYVDLKVVLEFTHAALRIRRFVLAARAMVRDPQFRVDVKQYFKTIRLLHQSKRR